VPALHQHVASRLKDKSALMKEKRKAAEIRQNATVPFSPKNANTGSPSAKGEAAP
jgi:hypothetical protein